MKFVSVPVLRNMRDNDYGKKVASFASISSEEDEDENDFVYADLDEVDDNNNSEHDEETSAFSENMYLQRPTRNYGHAAL